MYISHVTIINYRNFSQFEINLKPFTLIIGENNIGKSNLLNALGLIFSQDITFFKKRVLDIDDINCQAISNFKSLVVDASVKPDKIEFPEVKVEVTLKEFDLEQSSVVGDWWIDTSLSEARLTYVFKIRNNLDKDDWIAKTRDELFKNIKQEQGEDVITFKGRIEKSVDFPIGDYEYIIFGANDPSKRAESRLLRMLKMEYLEALRDAAKELTAGRDYRLLYRILTNRDEGYFFEIKEALIALKNMIDSNKELKKVKEEIKTYLDKISLEESGATQQEVDFHFTSPESSEIFRKISLIYGESPVSIERNGLGRSNLLYISLILSHLTKNNSKSDKIFFRLIGIEEPESHLHPHLQDHLSRNIKNDLNPYKDMQVILTSHSTHIASKLDLENTVILYRHEDQKIKSHYILDGLEESSRDKKSELYLKKYLDASNSTMFFARRLILVEGISEELLIPLFFKISQSDNTLEKFRCSIVNVKGVAFRHFLKIISYGYFIKCLVLTDSDANKKTEERADSLQADFLSIKSIKVCKTVLSTFEKDIIESNKNGEGKNTLFRALVATRPVKGKELEDKVGAKDINVEEFFQNIEGYKAEFAFNLAESLKENQKGFNIPAYILSGFNHIMDKHE